MLRALRFALAVVAAVLPLAAAASPADEMRALYERFYTAQNAHDVEGVRATLLPSERFLWVSDGQSFWGAETMLERMSLFQQAPVWEVVPGLAVAEAVEVGSDAAYLHLPLVLRIGPTGTPDELPFLVSVLGVATADGWRIAALFTTTAKQP